MIIFFGYSTQALTYACKLLDFPLQPPTEEGAEARTRGGSKRVDNRRMKAILGQAGLDLIHPDFRR
jgi:hypothetical protein